MTSPPAGPAESGPAPEGARPAPPPRAGGLLAAPFRGGALLGFVLLAVLAGLSAMLEGGMEDEAGRLLLRPLVILAMAAALAFYSHRVILCALQDDRPVPWFADPRDETGWMQDLGSFAAVLIVALAPTLVLSLIADAVHAPQWVSWIVAAAGIAFAVYQMPFALVSTVLRQGALGAGLGGPRRAWRADSAAGRSAALPAALFLALFAISFAVAGRAVRPLVDAKPSADHTSARDTGRAVVFAIRLVAVWASFVLFRRAGAIARDLPQVREALE